MSSLIFDLANCSVTDPRPLSTPESVDECCLENTRALLTQLHSLAYSDKEIGYVIQLSKATSVDKLPFICTPPEPKELTKWDLYAKKNRINRSKRSRLQYDETAGDWVPRYGHKSAKHEKERKDWLREAKPDDKGRSNPFDVASIEKGIAKTKQALRETKNVLSQKRGRYSNRK